MNKNRKYQSQTKISRTRNVFNEINPEIPIVFQEDWIQATFCNSSKKQGLLKPIGIMEKVKNSLNSAFFKGKYTESESYND